MDQPGKVANPVRDQLNRETYIYFFPCPRLRLRIRSRETGSTVPSRVSLIILYTRVNRGIPPDFRGGVLLFVSTAIRHRASPEFIGSRNYVPMAFTLFFPPNEQRAGGGGAARILFLLFFPLFSRPRAGLATV